MKSESGESTPSRISIQAEAKLRPKFSQGFHTLSQGRHKWNRKNANELKSASLLNSRELFRFFLSPFRTPPPPGCFPNPLRHQLRVEFLPQAHMRKWNRLKCEFVLWRRSINGRGPWGPSRMGLGQEGCKKGGEKNAVLPACIRLEYISAPASEIGRTQELRWFVCTYLDRKKWLISFCWIRFKYWYVSL